MSNGTDIAAEIAAALAEAGEAVGEGPLHCTLRRKFSGPGTPWDDAEPVYLYYPLIAMDDEFMIRDMSGTLIGQTMRKLTVDATGETPSKSDQIAVGVQPDYVYSGTEWFEITDVMTTAPGGVALFHEVIIAG